MKHEMWAIENGHSSLGSELKNAIKATKALDVASAFISDSGLDKLLPALRKASYDGPIRLLTGCKQCFNQPSVFNRLLTAAQERGDALQVRISRNENFHWKAYFVMERKKGLVIIGSSNMTGDGLGASGELNAAIELPIDSAAFRNLHKPFENEWGSAMPLYANWIKRYDEVWRRQPKPVKSRRGPIKTLLGLGAPKREPDQKFMRFGIMSIEGFIKRSTERIISELTNWDERGWEAVAVHTSAVERNHRMVVFDFSSRRAYLADVADTATTKRTADGRHFVAVKKLRGRKWRRIGSSLRNELRSRSLISTWDDVKGMKIIPESRWRRLEASFSKA